jgi:arsenite oxidase small subunit
VLPPEPGPAPADPSRRRFAVWLWRVPVLAALAAAGYGAREAWRVHFNKPAPADPPVFETHDSVTVAPLARFHAPWEAVPFTLAGRPCLALRLPAPIPGGLVIEDGLAGAGAAARPAASAIALAGFSRICTHLGCLVDLNLDTEAIAFAFNHRGDGPRLTCACHYSVFDATRAGRAVSGPAVQPLPRVRLRLERDGLEPLVVADGAERNG